MASNPTPHFSACESTPTPPSGPVCVTGSEGPWVFLCAGIGGNAGSSFLFQKDIISQFISENLSHVPLCLGHGVPGPALDVFQPDRLLLSLSMGFVYSGHARPVPSRALEKGA